MIYVCPYCNKTIEYAGNDVPRCEHKPVQVQMQRVPDHVEPLNNDDEEFYD